ncbi:uncharacterized protein HaLaN_27053 [Haematococcus lacustris]|uniref:Translation initiation factor eIF2B subunit delta n=1 Tax=Haematococcus lacustris TaxID=44745 RepID=A0A6A0A8L6_HAELA|nr:uncharacterized protein HaLaN_27053 [Haematococcus lacustris]
MVHGLLSPAVTCWALGQLTSACMPAAGEAGQVEAGVRVRVKEDWRAARTSQAGTCQAARPCIASREHGMPWPPPWLPLTPPCAPAVERAGQGRAVELTGRCVVDAEVDDGDVILTFAASYIVSTALCEAARAGKRFRVVVVDSRPEQEGRLTLQVRASWGGGGREGKGGGKGRDVKEGEGRGRKGEEGGGRGRQQQQKAHHNLPSMLQYIPIRPRDPETLCCAVTPYAVLWGVVSGRVRQQEVVGLSGRQASQLRALRYAGQWVASLQQQWPGSELWVDVQNSMVWCKCDGSLRSQAAWHSLAQLGTGHAELPLLSSAGQAAVRPLKPQIRRDASRVRDDDRDGVRHDPAHQRARHSAGVPAVRPRNGYMSKQAGLVTATSRLGGVT